MDEEKYEVATELIAHAGVAKSCALEAIDEASEGRFDSAEELIQEGRLGFCRRKLLVIL